MPIETSTTPRHVLTVSQENWDLTYEENNWDLTLTYTEGNSITITNALVNSAIEDNPAATGASLGLGTAAYTSSSAYATASHTHGNITTDGKIGLNTTANLVVITTTGGALTTASRSGIDTRTSFPNTDVTNATTTGAADQLLRLNAGGNAVANVFIATEGVEAGEEGGDSGYLRIINTSGDAVTINNANASNAEVSLPTGSGTLALTSSADGSLSSTDITDFVTAVEAAAPNEVTSATTSDGTADLSIDSLLVGDSPPDIAKVFISSTGLNALGINAESGGSGIEITTSNGNAIFATSGDQTAIIASTDTATYTAEYRDNNTTQSAIERVRGWFVWFYNTFTGRLKTDDITDDREWTLPDRTGSIALTEDYTGGTAVIDVLTATVQGTLTANHIHGNLAGALYAHIRAGENLAKGDPVYVSGYHAGTGYAIVSKADASNAAKMPAIGVMDAAVSNNANGHMVINGTISDVNTAAYAVNDTLYVASGGGFTSTPPAANSQPVARVDRVNTNNGAIIVKVNGLASSGGNGVNDANKLARFSTSGTLPISNIGGLGSNVATFLATPTSANLAAAVTNETGSGSLVFAELPTLDSPAFTYSDAAAAAHRTSLSLDRYYVQQGINQQSSTIVYDFDNSYMPAMLGVTRTIPSGGSAQVANVGGTHWTSKVKGWLRIANPTANDSVTEVVFGDATIPYQSGTGAPTAHNNYTLVYVFCCPNLTNVDIRLGLRTGNVARIIQIFQDNVTNPSSNPVFNFFTSNGTYTNTATATGTISGAPTPAVGSYTAGTGTRYAFVFDTHQRAGGTDTTVTLKLYSGNVTGDLSLVGTYNLASWNPISSAATPYVSVRTINNTAAASSFLHLDTVILKSWNNTSNVLPADILNILKTA